MQSLSEEIWCVLFVRRNGTEIYNGGIWINYKINILFCSVKGKEHTVFASLHLTFTNDNYCLQMQWSRSLKYNMHVTYTIWMGKKEWILDK